MSSEATHPTTALGQRHPWQPTTFEDLRLPGDVQLSPDGTCVAFVVEQYIPERPKPRGRIWVVETAGGEARPLTDGPHGDSCPRWSPDGKWLAFVSRRDEAGNAESGKSGKSPAVGAGKPQLYVMPAAGGEPRRVCAMPNGVSELDWSPDGTRIAFLSLEGAEPSSEPKVNEASRHKRLWTVRFDYDIPEPVTPPDLTVWTYAWAPDSRGFAVFTSTDPTESGWFRGTLGTVPAAGGRVHPVAELDRQAQAPAFSRDGTRLAYVVAEWSDRPLVGGDVYLSRIADGRSTGEPRNLTPGVGFSPSWLREFPEGGRWLYTAWDHLSNSIGILDERTGTLTPICRDFFVGGWAWPQLSTTPDLRRFATIHSDRDTPPEVFVGELRGEGEAASIEWKRLTRLNPLQEETLERAPSERITYESVDGWTIEAFYTPPLNPPAGGKKPPLVLNVHGGPTSAYRESWVESWAQMFAAQGYAVLRPNPRGSVGRGVTFADAVLGDPGGKDFQDVMRGVDYLIERGLVDGDRLAIMGWSYGGFMTAWAVTQTTRFKAAIMGAGVSDFHSFHAQASIQEWDERIIGVPHWKDPEAYRSRSAMTYVSRVTTPTLIVHGENDEFVPVNQAYAFHRALRERGVPTELAVYPREGHGFRERDHVRDLNERMLRWLKTYL